MTAKRRKAPEEGPHGVDRWTSNGYGLTIGGKKVEPPKETDNQNPTEKNIDEIEEVDDK